MMLTLQSQRFFKRALSLADVGVDNHDVDAPKSTFFQAGFVPVFFTGV
jgi:hypothetical protein